MRDDDRPSVFIIGPTASGKGRMALEVARLAGGEVISVDSMKVYRGMDVGTAKPLGAARRGVPIHLVDIREPHEGMSAAEFVTLAREAEAGIRSRGRLPVFAGGTALYVRGLVEGVFEGPPADWALRRELEAEALAHGNAALHARLREVDPKTAARLHENDRRRVIRALEVFAKTGVPISSMQRQWSDFGGKDVREGGPHEGASKGPLLLGLLWPRPALAARIDERVDRMFEAGFLDEARRLRSRPEGVSREASQALGYRELFRHLDAGAPAGSLATVIDEVKRNTRRFARRQLTFFRHLPAVRWIDVEPATDPAELARGVVAGSALQ